MLILNFTKEDFEEEIYYLINEKFPGIKYETKKTKTEIQICISTNDFELNSIQPFIDHKAFVDFKCKTSGCDSKIKKCCRCEEEKIVYAKCSLFKESSGEKHYFCKECLEKLQEMGICAKNCSNLEII